VRFRARVFCLTQPPRRHEPPWVLWRLSGEPRVLQQAGRNFCRTQHPYAAMPPWPGGSHHQIDVMVPSQINKAPNRHDHRRRQASAIAGSWASLGLLMGKSEWPSRVSTSIGGRLGGQRPRVAGRAS
jgi:hypothetical protein